jgi:hypothetical protein
VVESYVKAITAIFMTYTRPKLSDKVDTLNGLSGREGKNGEEMEGFPPCESCNNPTCDSP